MLCIAISLKHLPRLTLIVTQQLYKVLVYLTVPAFSTIELTLFLPFFSSEEAFSELKLNLKSLDVYV